MALTKAFQNGHSQAIRIPKEMQTDRKEFIMLVANVGGEVDRNR